MVTAEEIYYAIQGVIREMVEAVKLTLERTPPELAADVVETGIVLTGGGAMIKGLDTLIALETKIYTSVANNPLDCVARGTGKVIDNFDDLQLVLIGAKGSRY